ncbi:MAG: S8 family serine peptidase, partial [Prolixibacteraceae bacterium]|nr:S8 family serine peptidase [Prolixibacteraceae bacterium]
MLTTKIALRKILLIVILSVLYLNVFSQNKLSREQIKNIVSESNQDKILSGKLIEKVYRKQAFLKSGSIKKSDQKTDVVIYFSSFPNENQKKQLSDLGITCYYETWTPPVGSHPYGFIIASLPVNKLNTALALPFIKKMDTAEKTFKALNNNATRSVRANMVWSSGYKGKGVKIGILDSGIDISYAGTDLPENFEYKDYSYFPDIDDDVANTTTGHGTHVAATALGRGILSQGKDPAYNGEGAYIGAAPEADLTFIKIGNDTNASASDAAIIAAIDAAVNIYHVDVLSMSYGGWDDYHDGTSATEQKVDWAYNLGVPFFLSAGNSADDDRHWSGTIPGSSASDFIELVISGADTIDIQLIFNLVWSDGAARNDLTLEYYDHNKTLINDITWLPTTESTKGTESQNSHSNFTLPQDAETYYLKVVNNSSNDQFCHIYEQWTEKDEGDYNVWFNESDQMYTIGSPASADFGLAVGAYVSRHLTTDYSGSDWVYNGYELDSLARFSSRGPRMDGVIKPDICAPGHVTISLRDKDVYKVPDKFWIDNDGITNEGEANYYRMRGTSMACPIAAGCAALYLEQFPDATPQEIYNAMKNFANVNGINGVPNNNWGAGRLNMANILNLVELLAPEDNFMDISINPTLWWIEESTANTYNVQVSETEDFANPVISFANVDTNFVEIENLKYLTKYYWRVQIAGNQGINGWSEKWCFTTGGIPTNAGYALWFDGTDDYLIVPHSAALDEIETNDKITLEAWVKMDDWTIGRFPLIENFKPDINWGWGFQFHDTNGMEVGMIWTATDLGEVPPMSQWFHVAVSYDRAANTVKYYINGELSEQKNFNGDIPDTSFDDWLQIAINAAGWIEYSHGTIDELRIWKTIRTQAEIQNNIYRMLDGTENGLAALFNFNTGKGFEFVDPSGNFQNGHFVNQPIWVVSTLPQQCEAPAIGLVTQPYCGKTAGSVVLENLPANGNWIITRTPDGG